MKNCILKGLCLFFMLLSLAALLVPIAFAAQDGHGGSTEVIARIHEPTERVTDETQPFTEPTSQTDSSSGSASGGTPVQTGYSVLWLILSAACLAAALLLIFRLRSDQNKSK